MYGASGYGRRVYGARVTTGVFKKVFIEVISTSISMITNLRIILNDILSLSVSLSTILIIHISFIFTESLHFTSTILKTLNGVLLDIWNKVIKLSTTWSKVAKYDTIWNETEKQSTSWTKQEKRNSQGGMIPGDDEGFIDG